MEIRSTGLGSGIDINGTVKKIVDAEAVPQRKRLDKQEASVQSTVSSLGSLKGALSGFESALKDLADADKFTSRKASSSNTDIFTATADATSIPGSYRIEVEQLATAHKLQSTDFGDADGALGSGTLSFSSGENSFSIAVGAGQNIEDVRNAINNASDNKSVNATIINTDAGKRLIFTAKNTGEEARISISVTDNDGNNTDNQGLSRLQFDGANQTGQMVQTTAAQNARVLIDGALVTSKENILTSAITGVKIALDGAEDDKEYILSISQDSLQMEGKVKKFIDSYNTLLDLTNKLTSYDAKTGKTGAMFGDSMLRTVTTQIRRVITDKVDGVSGQYSSLAELGVKTNREKGGKLELDTTKFNKAVTADPGSVAQIFSNKDGVATRLTSVLKNYTKYEGIIDGRTTSLNKQLEKITEERVDISRRLKDLESRLYKQFNAMDRNVARFKNLSTYLAEQLKLLPFAKTTVAKR
ncbi:MAG: flagellar filament capping protein FliD [Amphritea sp.]|nr:flagellar filament capping protein FliD [Amphritea sp.]